MTTSIYKDKEGVILEKRWDFMGIMESEGKTWLVNIMSGQLFQGFGSWLLGDQARQVKGVKVKVNYKVNGVFQIVPQ